MQGGLLRRSPARLDLDRQILGQLWTFVQCQQRSRAGEPQLSMLELVSGNSGGIAALPVSLLSHDGKLSSVSSNKWKVVFSCVLCMLDTEMLILCTKHPSSL